MLTNLLMFWTDVAFPFSLALVVAGSVPFALGVTLLTKPEPIETLRAFYARVRPPGFWKPVAPGASSSGLLHIVRVVCGTVGVYAWLLAFGWLLLGRPVAGAVALAVGTLTLGFAAASLNAPPEARSRT